MSTVTACSRKRECVILRRRLKRDGLGCSGHTQRGARREDLQVFPLGTMPRGNLRMLSTAESAITSAESAALAEDLARAFRSLPAPPSRDTCLAPHLNACFPRRAPPEPELPKPTPPRAIVLATPSQASLARLHRPPRRGPNLREGSSGGEARASVDVQPEPVPVDDEPASAEAEPEALADAEPAPTADADDADPASLDNDADPASVDVEPAPQPPQQKDSTAALRNLRNRSGMNLCDFCGLQVYQTERVEHLGRHYHKACFKCAYCGSSLRGVQHSKIDDCLYCSAKGTFSCFFKARAAPGLAADSNPAHERVLSEQEIILQLPGAKRRASSMMSSEHLETAVRNMVPRCALCDQPFSGAEDLVMHGAHVKLHARCQQAYRDAGRLNARAAAVFTPAMALAKTPTRVVFKLRCLRGSVKTFFLMRARENVASDAEGATQLEAQQCVYVPDAESALPNVRRCVEDDLVLSVEEEDDDDEDQEGEEEQDSSQVWVIGGDGAQIGPSAPLRRVAATDSGGNMCARVAWTRSGLKWELRATFLHDPSRSTLRATQSTLTIAIPSEVSGARPSAAHSGQLGAVLREIKKAT